MIEVKNLTKAYGRKKAVDDISFTALKGEVLGLLGPNGAGKSTTMNMITGYTSSTSGTVRVGGAEILEDPIRAKAQIGYLPEHPPLYPDMTVRDYLSFMYDLKKAGGSRTAKKDHILEICSQVMVEDVMGRMIKHLSKGYQQRVGLAQALLGSPGVLILDEPTVGLDPRQIIDIRNLIKSLGRKYTVILSSHILHEVQSICDRVIILHKGRLIADGTPGELSHRTGADTRLCVRVAGPQEEVLSMLRGLEGIVRVAPLQNLEAGAFDFAMEAAPGADIRRALFACFSRQGWPILQLKSGEMTLEDIFLRLIGDGEESPPVKADADAKGGAAQ